MYEYIYFDLDDTLVSDNPSTGKSELLKSGYDEYIRLKGIYPNAKVRLLTNRPKGEISFPVEYVFDEIIGKEDMDLYVLEHMNDISWKVFLNPKNIYIYLNAKSLYSRGFTSKAFYLFLRHICRGERVLMIDDDKRVELLFRL